MTKAWLTMFAAGTLLGSACASAHMTDDTGEMHAAIAGARAENARHQQACVAADSLDGVMGELARHENGMMMMTGRMETALGGMSHCSGSGMGRMHEGMSDMQASMDGHRLRLEAAAEVETAHTACGAHASGMDAMLLGMDGELGRMSCMAR